ncbi:MAG: DNA translocase FtsK 4TM domain-containing protein [Anaerolineae bacterium]
MAGKRSRRRGWPSREGLHIHLDWVLQQEILGLLLLAGGTVAFLSLLSITHGALSDRGAELLRQVFGWGAYGVVLGLGAVGVALVLHTLKGFEDIPWERVIGAELFMAASLALLHLLSGGPDPLRLAQEGGGGGYVGWAISHVLATTLGPLVAAFLLAVVGLVGLVWMLHLSPAELVGSLVREARQAATRSPEAAEPPLPETMAAISPREAPPTRPQAVSLRRPRARKRRGAEAEGPVLSEAEGLPPLDLLDPASPLAYREGEIRQRSKIIEETLASFGLPVRVVSINQGPTVTQFGVEPGYIERRGLDGRLKRRKVRVSKISALAKDLALALAAAPIRIEAPVPGQHIVGIEVPNSQISLVALRGVMESEAFQALDSKLKLALGQDVSGQPIVADLATMPHLLIAGATGSGKSVCINAIIACLLCQRTPEELQLLLIDPKRVELTNFNGIPHLLAPVVVEVEEVIRALRWITGEMDKRFRLFARAGVRDIEAYNRKMARRDGERLPYIVIFIDELADLMMISPDEVERLVCRIAQLARATGIHLVMATQRPSVDVVTGLIKANFPARISFAVTSQVDSRVVLDTGGAEKLLGRGDMLYMASDSSKLVRLQGSYVSDKELAKLVRFWKRASRWEPAEEGEAVPWEGMAAEEGEADELLEEAIALVQQHERASVSFLQRKLRIGYPRAARLMDQLEKRGIVGPDEGGGRSREVLVSELGDEAPEE